MILSALTDEELLRHYHAEHCPLTSTPLADELARRFATLVDLERHQLITVLEEHSLENVETLKTLIERFGDRTQTDLALLEMLDEEGVYSTEDLRSELDLADKFRALANDAGDVITRLNDLITNAQE